MQHRCFEYFAGHAELVRVDSRRRFNGHFPTRATTEVSHESLRCTLDRPAFADGLRPHVSRHAGHFGRAVDGVNSSTFAFASTPLGRLQVALFARPVRTCTLAGRFDRQQVRRVRRVIAERPNRQVTVGASLGVRLNVVEAVRNRTLHAPQPLVELPGHGIRGVLSQAKAPQIGQ